MVGCDGVPAWYGGNRAYGVHQEPGSIRWERGLVVHTEMLAGCRARDVLVLRYPIASDVIF